MAQFLPHSHLYCHELAIIKKRHDSSILVYHDITCVRVAIESPEVENFSPVHVEEYFHEFRTIRWNVRGREPEEESILYVEKSANNIKEATAREAASRAAIKSKGLDDRRSSGHRFLTFA